jgi:eukaryotic-like serine/threonine-protein kinase
VYDEEPPVYDRRPRGGSVVLVSILTSAITSAGVFYGLRAYEARGGPSVEETVEVPSVAGMTIEQARGLLDSKGLILTLEAERDDATVPAGAIISQAPLAGSRARASGEVRATVSRGLSEVEVPDVANLTVDEATKKLGAARLTVKGSIREPHATFGADRVAGTRPPASTKTPADTAVELVVSSGPAEVEVPKVTGLSMRKAKEALTAAGFEVGSTIVTYDEDRGPYVVLKQDPAAGAKAAKGAKINLVINEGE